MKLATKLFVTSGVLAALLGAHLWQVDHGHRRQREDFLRRQMLQANDTRLLDELYRCREQLDAVLAEPEPHPAQWSAHLRRGRDALAELRRLSAQATSSPRLGSAGDPLRATLEEFAEKWTRYETTTPDLQSASTAGYRLRELLPLAREPMHLALGQLDRAARQAAAADKNQAIDAIDATRARNFFGLAVLVLAVALGGLHWHRLLIRPLRRMAADAEDINAGRRYDIRHPYQRSDELGALGAAFNTALDSLKAGSLTRDELQHLAAQRTAELARSDASLQRLIDAAALGFWDWDVAGNRAVFSGHWAALLGYRLDEIEHAFSTWENLLHPEDRPAALAAIHAYIAGEARDYEIEHRLRTASGEWKWILTRALIVERDPAGRATRIAGMHADIHARKIAEEEARRREVQLRQLADNLPEGALYQFVVRPDGSTVNTYVGEGFKRILGVDGTVLLFNRGWLRQHLEPEDANAMVAASDDAIREQRPFRGACRFRTAQGETKWLSFRAHPRPASDGDVIWDGIMIDITAHKEAEAAISRQVDFLAALNETAVDLLNRREQAPLLQAIVERTSRLLDAAHVELSFLENGDTLVTRACAGGSTAFIGDRATRNEAQLSWSAIDHRAPRLVDDYSAAPGVRPVYRDLALRAVAVFPILHGSECLGVLGLARVRPGQVFNLEDLQKGQLLAQLVALVLHNSAIYDDAVRLAEARTHDLRDSEWRLREAQRIAHIGHWEFSFAPGNTLERWSDETYRIFGLEPQSIAIDRAVFDQLIHPDDLADFRSRVADTWANPRRVELNYRIVRPDGSIRHIHDEGEPKRDERGQILGMQGIVQDVTERTHAEAALREREQLYRSLVETIDHGYYIANYRSTFTYVSPTMEAMGGFAPGELLGRSSFRLIADEDRARVMNEYRRWRDDPAAQNVRTEFRVLARHGRKFWVEQTTHFVRDASGRVTEGRNVLRDITERRAAEQALREREERFRSVFDHSPIPIVLSRLPGGQIVAANAAAERAFGHSVADSVGLTTMQLGIWNNGPEREAFLRLLAERGSVTGHEVRLRNRDGETLRMLFSASLVRLGGESYVLSSILDVTAQKRAEDSLRDSESRFKRVVENIGDALMVDDAEGHIVFANDRFLEMFRLTRGELANRTIYDLMPSEIRDSSRAAHRARLAGQDVPALFEEEALRADGSRFWVELRVTPVHENGRRIGSQAALRDVTERRLIDRTLRLLSTGTAQLSGSHFFDYVALRLAEIVGLEGCAIATHGPEGWRTLALKIDAQSVESRAPDSAPGTLAHAVFSERITVFVASVSQAFPQDRWLAELGIVGCAAAPLLSGPGEVIGFVAFLSRQEIVHLPQVESVLHLAAVRIAAEIARGRNERQFQDLFEFAPDAIVMIDAHRRIVRTNQRVEKMFGQTPSALVGQPLDALITDAERTVGPRLGAAFEDARRRLDSRTQLTALEGRRRDGSTFPVEVSLGAVETEVGTQIAAAIRDITEQRIAEARLRQTQKIEALGTLAGGIAHDFNNLLTGMFGFVELSRAELPTDHPARPWLDHISTAARRARNLVQQILTFSRQNEGQRTPVDVGNVAAEALRLLRSTIPPMVQIEAHLAPQSPPVLADSTQLHQVIMNLCTNAWHALPESGGRIRVGVEALTISDEVAAAQPGMPRGAVVRLSVADNGSGIPASVLDRIFDPFFTTKPAGKGTGLGLAVVHGVVRAHGGTITVQSTPGQGTTFEIFLPAIRTPVEAAPSQLPTPRGHGERILIIDDEPIGRTALAAMLEHLGYRVEHFENPETAVTHFALQPGLYALVVTDFAMPGMTGIEVSRMVRQIRADIPVLLVSGNIDPQRQAELEGAGITVFLQKPPTMDEIGRAVARAVAPPAAAATVT